VALIAPRVVDAEHATATLYKDPCITVIDLFEFWLHFYYFIILFSCTIHFSLSECYSDRSAEICANAPKCSHVHLSKAQHAQPPQQREAPIERERVHVQRLELCEESTQTYESNNWMPQEIALIPVALLERERERERESRD
jgi:hypothetical protein